MLENTTFEELELNQTAIVERTLTKEDIQAFALVTGDINPAHVDEQFAQTDIFHEVIGHGMWGGALISMVLGTHLPGPGTIYLSQDLRFLKPIKLGDTVTISLTVIEKITKHRHVIFECICKNQLGDILTEGHARVIAPSEKIIRKETHLPKLKLIDAGEHSRNIIERARSLGRRIKVAVVHPCSEESLLGAFEAKEKELVTPVIIGPLQRLKKLAGRLNINIDQLQCIDVKHSHAAAAKAVELAHLGEVDSIMKGSLHTDELMQAVLNRQFGLRTDKRVSHCFVMDIPSYGRPLIITDGAINLSPDLEAKRDIVQHAIDLAHALGVTNPKVALLAAVETVSSKMQCTIDAAALCKMADRQQIKGGVLDGPLAFDNAVSEHAAEIKGIKSEVAGLADILMVPDLVSGNVLAKQLSYLSQAKGAGIVLGANVPIVLTSRADDSLTRETSCALAVLLSHYNEECQYAKNNLDA
uniref:bifunctional enoyl-CoA hydratase/phosphate acetyltransferase n=1 Tax=Piscirickettsia salmonis TaxID=1238 RepID=UPI0026D6D3EA